METANPPIVCVGQAPLGIWHVELEAVQRLNEAKYLTEQGDESTLRHCFHNVCGSIMSIAMMREDLAHEYYTPEYAEIVSPVMARQPPFAPAYSLENTIDKQLIPAVHVRKVLREYRDIFNAETERGRYCRGVLEDVAKVILERPLASVSLVDLHIAA